MDKGIEKTIKALRKDGWTVDVARGKHYKVTLKKGDFKSPCIVFSSTPSDRNAVRNVIGDFKKAAKVGGYDLPEINKAY